MDELIQLIRMALKEPGPQGRQFNLKQMAYHRVIPPDWIFEAEEREMGRGFDLFYHERRDLLAFGQIVWGHIVQANSNLFEQAEGDSPGDVIFSPEPIFDSELGRLSIMGKELFQLKNTKPSDPLLANLANHLTDEMQAIYHHPLPAPITGGHKVYFSSFMIHRKHLPNHYLASTWVPLLICPGRCTHVMIVPAAYWPPPLLEMWL